jgi:hypothetical protein
MFERVRSPNGEKRSAAHDLLLQCGRPEVAHLGRQGRRSSGPLLGVNRRGVLRGSGSASVPSPLAGAWSWGDAAVATTPPTGILQGINMSVALECVRRSESSWGTGVATSTEAAHGTPSARQE